jgi:molecular chaperone GrpE
MNKQAPKSNDPGPDGAELHNNFERDLQPGTNPPTGAGAAPEAGEMMSATEQISQLKHECDELRDQALRARADFANYQKRAKQQADADRIYAVGTLAKDLLEPLDNLDRAIAALRAKGAEGITTGLDMVQKQLLDVLAKHGVEPISAHGQPFDPNLHDAILQQPAPEVPEGTVVAEMSKGYTIRDRVLRPSRVAVSVKPTGQEG